MKNIIVEIWKDIPNCKKYEASNLGNIRHKKIKNNLKPQDNGHGYKYFTIKENGCRKNIYIHIAVMNTFYPIDNSNRLYEVNHKDFNKSNNTLENLEWLTTKDNNNHALENGRFLKRSEINRKRLKNLCHLNQNPLQNLSKESKQRVLETRKNNYIPENHPCFGRYGENSYNNKLTQEQVDEIRKSYLEKKNTMQELAKIFNVDYTTINYIINKRTWKE